MKTYLSQPVQQDPEPTAFNASKGQLLVVLVLNIFS